MPSRKRKINVLIVDDSKADITLLKRAFDKQDADLNIEYCLDGQSALDYLAEAVKGKNGAMPDVCLLDIKMPGMSGIDVLKEIKSNKSTRSIGVYMLSSSDSPKDIQLSFEFECNGYLQKPRQRSDLEDMVSSLVNIWTGPSRFLS